MTRNISAHSPATVKVVCWVLSMTAACVIVIRFATKLAVVKKWSVDDTMIVFGLAFSIVQSITLTTAASYGFGDLIPVSDSSQVQSQEKFIYGSNIVFFLSMTFGMLATSQLILNLSPDPTHRIISWTITTATILWSIIAVFGAAFQCQLPDPWEANEQCIHQRAFYTFVICANALIELGLILQPVLVVAKLQLALRRKWFVMACFFSRFFVIFALAGLLITVWETGADGANFSSYGVVICSILAGNFSIIAANMPYLRPFLQGLESGKMMGMELSSRHIHSKGSRDPGISSISSGLSRSRKMSLASPLASPQLQTIQDYSTDWKIEHIEEPSKAFSMADMKESNTIVQSVEFHVESHPISRR